MDIKELIAEIKDDFASGKFQHFIEYIRFPFYRNLEENTFIRFDFPFAVFTGQNGSGKSSTLHAIQGAPGGESPTKYWYSTPLDPINDNNGNPHCFIYGYYNKSRSKILEVLKTRINLRDNPDYWEPSRPLKKYGMETLKGSRNPTINKPVIYYDFRAELSAYDKYFYFGELKKTIRIQSKQDYIRRYSWRLKKVIDENSIETFAGIPKNRVPEKLSVEGLDIVSRILGKKYIECKIIEHSWFKNFGTTVYFKTDSGKYSEAFAGRGEFAVVKIVHEILKARPFSLVVLDEPEVSLHPGAQLELKKFLLEQTLKRKLQVIISTHSPHFVEGLPEIAIKLFYPSTSGKFLIQNQTHESEAFNFIGFESKNNRIIQVEDVVAQILLEKILDVLGHEYKLIFQVVFYPGGSSQIYKNAVKYSLEGEKNKFLLLDGDEYKPKRDPSTLTLGEAQDFEFLAALIKKICGIEFQKLGFQIDGIGTGGSVEQKKSQAIKFLEFAWSNLDYLPGGNPEELIWDSNFANSMLKQKKIASQNFKENFKENFFNFCHLFVGDTTESSMLVCHKLFIDNFCNKKNSQFDEIVKILTRFKSMDL